MKAPYPVYKSEFDDIKSLEAYNLVLDITKEQDHYYHNIIF